MFMDIYLSYDRVILPDVLFLIATLTFISLMVAFYRRISFTWISISLIIAFSLSLAMAFIRSAVVVGYTFDGSTMTPIYRENPFSYIYLIISMTMIMIYVLIMADLGFFELAFPKRRRR